MKIYLDDDDEFRHTPEGWVRCHTAQEVIEHLKTGVVTAIDFDHDLGDETVVGNGRMVADWIDEAAFHGTIKPIEWSIHSGNPTGRKNIERAMTSAERFWAKIDG